MKSRRGSVHDKITNDRKHERKVVRREKLERATFCLYYIQCILWETTHLWLHIWYVAIWFHICYFDEKKSTKQYGKTVSISFERRERRAGRTVLSTFLMHDAVQTIFRKQLCCRAHDWLFIMEIDSCFCQSWISFEEEVEEDNAKLVSVSRDRYTPISPLRNSPRKLESK